LYIHVPYENWRFPNWLKSHLSLAPPFINTMYVTTWPISKRGISERCYRTRRGRTDEQRYAIISPYFDGRIKMIDLYPEITNISFLAKLFFKTFISLKHLSDYRTVGLSDYRTVGLSDYSYGPQHIQMYIFYEKNF
jgi:hypothetical protein